MAISKRVLAVDDDPMNLMIIEEILAGTYELATARSGDEAVETAADFRPDLILLDIMLPGMNGYEACRRLRARDDLKFTKIVLVSAKATVAERLEGYAVGADDYVIKPFNHDELLAKVEVFLRLKSVEEMDLLKSNFLTLLGHETRTPVAQILAAAELLETCQELAQMERAQLAQIVTDAARRLDAMIEQALLYFSIKEDQTALCPAQVDLAHVVRHLADAHSWPSPSPSLEVAIESDAAYLVESDPEYLNMALRFLVLNAAQCDGSPGGARVELDARDGRARIAITGSRPYPESTDPSRLFDVFYVPDLDHHGGALDFRLPLAREILRRAGGDVSARRSRTGQCVLQATLPLSGASEMREAA